MSKAFIVGPEGIVGGIGETERRLFQGIFSSVIDLLEPEEAESADPLEALIGWNHEVSVPTDPALRRLLPDAVAEDDDAALELRRLTERSVRQSKVGALRAASLMFDSEELRLSLPQAELLVRALNDVRLVMAERLGLDTPEAVESLHEGAETSEEDEDFLAIVYRFASALQGALVHAMLALRKAERKQAKREGQQAVQPTTDAEDPGAESPEAEK
ncbi:DUF2017 family protein [Psychromicrobium sp. YIM B11713]|uniref:DUF2017 family protein n=1 Tax=Psychromicrobium sp. YIM B11713 TaxID=3145233 RepID=UPI00374E6DAA